MPSLWVFFDWGLLLWLRMCMHEERWTWSEKITKNKIAVWHWPAACRPLSMLAKASLFRHGIPLVPLTLRLLELFGHVRMNKEGTKKKEAPRMGLCWNVDLAYKKPYHGHVWCISCIYCTDIWSQAANPFLSLALEIPAVPYEATDLTVALRSAC